MTDIRLTNYNMATARLIGGLLFTPLLALIAFALLYELSSLDLRKLLAGILGILGAIAFAWMAITAVISMTIGNELRIRTFFGTKHYPLREIGGIRFGNETTRTRFNIPVATHLMMYLRLQSGRGVMMKVTQAEREQVIAALNGRGLQAVFQEQLDSP